MPEAPAVPAVPTVVAEAPARVNFAGTTAIPRTNEKTGEPFFSCYAPCRNATHVAVNFTANSEDEVAEIVAVGVVALSELTVTTEDYTNNDGEDATELVTSIGAIRARGEW